MTTAAATTDLDNARHPGADDERTPLPLRGDTLLGVCEAVGQDLGFNPSWLRIAFAGLLMWNVEVVVVAYLALGVVVAATRWFFPVSARSKSAPDSAATQDDASAVGQDSREEELLAA